MPLYEYACARCDKVHEKLTRVSDMQQTSTCPTCGEVSKRKLSGFSIAGAAPKTRDASLQSSGRDFANDPDKFVTAMDTFGEKIGNPLTSKEKERAVERLKKSGK